MQQRIPGFRGEFLWELDVPEIQLLALAAAIPSEVYEWQPADGARTLSEVLVHVATANLGLLRIAGVRAPASDELYSGVEGSGIAAIAAMVAVNTELERTVRQKPAVLELLTKSFRTVRETFEGATDAELERSGDFFGEITTVRRVYFRMLAHTHEHMGQAIAYARMNGLRMPWPDAREALRQLLEAEHQTAKA